MTVDAPTELDLGAPRGVWALLGLTLSLLVRHSLPFLSATLLVVAPPIVLVDGLWGGVLAHGADADPGTLAEVASWTAAMVVTPALVTALHCSLVREIGAGRRPRLRAALEEVAPRALPVLAVVALYTGVAVAGLAALVLPGVWLGVLLYFGAQAVVLDGLGPVAALRRSAALVRGRWWETFGRLVLGNVVCTLPAALVGQLPLSPAGPLASVAVNVGIQTVTTSFMALFGTLLFFSLRSAADART